MTSNPYAKNSDENNSLEKKENLAVKNVKLRRQMSLKRKPGYVVLKFLLLLIVNVDKTEKDLSPVQTQMEEAINGLMVQAKQDL